MKTFEFGLNLNNAKAIPFDKYEKNFAFIIDGKRYETSRFVADFLSPIIRQYHYQDETIGEYIVNIDDKNREDHSTEKNDYFSEFLNLISINKTQLNPTQRKYYSEYFLHLGNFNEYFSLHPMFSEDITLDNIIDHLQNINSIISNKVYKNTNQPEILHLHNNVKKVIDFASSNFEEISKEKLIEFDVEIIEEIIKNELLQLSEEDVLLDFILELYKKNKKYSYLFEYVYFNNIKIETMKKFIEKFKIKHLNLGIWQSLCERMIQSNDEKRLYKHPKSEILSFDHKKGDEFNGIIKFLTEKAGGNIHDKKVVEITSNSVNGDSCKPQNIFDFQNNNLYNSQDKPDSFICIDFKEKMIQLSKYTIKSSTDGPNGVHLRNWIIEASNDGNSWEKIDEHADDESLNKGERVVTFEVKNNKSFYKFIRLKQTGKNWRNKNDYFIEIYSLELYGKLIIPKDK